MKLLAVLATASLSTAVVAGGADMPAAAAKEGDGPLMVSFAELKWTDLPQRKGMPFAALSGDPAKGAYTQMRRVPAGTDNPLHTHSSTIKNVIISGVRYTGTDMASARDFGPGSIVVIPDGWVHVSGCRSGSDCVFYREGKGKLDFNPMAGPNAGRQSILTGAESPWRRGYGAAAVRPRVPASSQRRHSPGRIRPALWYNPVP